MMVLPVISTAWAGLPKYCLEVGRGISMPGRYVGAIARIAILLGPIGRKTRRITYRCHFPDWRCLEAVERIFATVR